MFFCKLCEIFKNTYFEEHLGTTASEPLLSEIFVGSGSSYLCYLECSLQKTLSKSTINVLLSCPWILFLCCCWWLGKTLRIVFTHNPRTLSIRLIYWGTFSLLLFIYKQEQVKYMRHILYIYICIYIYIYIYIYINYIYIYIYIIMKMISIWKIKNFIYQPHIL